MTLEQIGHIGPRALDRVYPLVKLADLGSLYAKLLVLEFDVFYPVLSLKRLFAEDLVLLPEHADDLLCFFVAANIIQLIAWQCCFKVL